MNEAQYLKGPCRSCGNNIEFPQTGLGSVVECPHCGQRTPLSSRSHQEASSRKRPRPGLLALIVCAFLAVVLGMGFFLLPRGKPAIAVVSDEAVKKPADATKHTGTQAADKSKKSLQDLQAGEISLEKTKGSSLVYAVGVITNDSGSQRFGVKVTLNLLDQKGGKVGTTQDYIGVLEPRQAWQFRALITDPKAVTATLDSIKEEN